MGFKFSAGGNATVRFACPKGHLECPGTVVDDSTMTFDTPNFEKFGPVEVRKSNTVSCVVAVMRCICACLMLTQGRSSSVSQSVGSSPIHASPQRTTHPLALSSCLLQVEGRLAIAGKSLTNSVVHFSYFSVANANTTVAFGPGVLSGSAATVPTVFVIQARDNASANR